MATITYRKSKSGFYRVKLAKTFEDRGFLYKPAHEVTVNQEILDLMIADEAVESVLAVD